MATAVLKSAPECPARPVAYVLTSCQVMQTVTVSGQDLSGLAFVDDCRTIAIADNGAIVMIGRTLAIEQEIFIRYADREVLACIIRHSEVGNYGVCFVASNPGFWGEASASPGVDSHRPPEGKFRDEAQLATDPLLVSNFAPFEEVIPRKTVARVGERRRTARITLRQAKACIEIPGANHDIVELIDVSRGGVCFRSERSYALHSRIRIAAPILPETPTFLFLRSWSASHEAPVVTSMEPSTSANPTSVASYNPSMCHPRVSLVSLLLLSALALAQSRTASDLQFQTKSLPSASIGRPYAATIQVTGGVPPFSFSVVRGKLPPGIVLQPNSGILSGTPSAPGDYIFTIAVTDATRKAIAADFTIRVENLLVVRWRQRPTLDSNTLSGSVDVANYSSDVYDQTVIIVAVNEIGKAFALGYQHFDLAPQVQQTIPFSSSLPNGNYIVHVDAVAEIPSRRIIRRARLQTEQPILVDVNR